EASQGLEAVANRGISFVLPGFGHLLLGQAVRGSLYLGLCAVTLSYLAVSPLILPDSDLVGTPSLLTGAAAALVLAMVYLVAGIDTLRRRA
ncbi:MAG: hypothetical protein ACI9WU_002722, partial [Myxococcota bacterium]